MERLCAALDIAPLRWRRLRAGRRRALWPRGVGGDHNPPARRTCCGLQHHVNLDTWLVYLLAAIGLSLSPGPNGLLALTHGALYGPQRTLYTVLGGSLGFFVLYAVSMFGIGAVVAASPTGLWLLKWAGGAYLVWLGLQIWRSAPIMAMETAPSEVAPSRVQARQAPSGAVLFRQGAVCAMTNPKGLLFLIAFLPQFVDPARSLWMQFLIMAGTFVLIEIGTESAIAASAHGLKAWLARVGRRFNQACGALFVLIGVALPLR